MKTTTKTLTATIVMYTSTLLAQDIIYTTDNKQIKARVNEVGLNEIKYRMFENQFGPVIVMRKTEVNKIQFENGTELKITPEKYAVHKEAQILNKTSAIKFHIFSPLIGNLAFGYERMLKVGTNGEGKLGIIGPGLGDAAHQATGFYLKGGVKFLLGQDFAIEGLRYAHPLKGRYIKLELGYSMVDRKDVEVTDYNTYNSNWLGTYTAPVTTKTNVNANALCLNVVYGRQWILGTSMTFEWYTGLGYGAEWKKYSNVKANDSNTFTDSNYYGFIQGGKGFPVSFSSGITLGYLIK